MPTAAEQLDHTALYKGQYKGESPSQIAEHDPSYVVWMYETWNPKPCSALLYDECRQTLRSDRRYGDDDDSHDSFDDFPTF